MLHPVPEHFPLAGEQRVDQDDAGHLRRDAVIEHVEPSRPRDPAEMDVEHQEPDEAEPEHRHGIADEPDDAHDMVDEASLVHRGEDAERHADQDADEGRRRRQLERRREHPFEILDDGLCRDHRIAEIAVQHRVRIDHVLLDQRPVELELVAQPVIGFGRRPVAEDRHHRIDRDDPADHEGDDGEAEEGQHDRDREAQELARQGDPRRAAAFGTATSVAVIAELPQPRTSFRACPHREEPPRGGVSNGETRPSAAPQHEEEFYCHAQFTSS